MKIDKYKMALDLLKYFQAQDRPVLRANVIGLEYQEGNFGLFHNKTLTPEERYTLDLVLKELQDRHLVQPVYRDLMSRGEDLVITDRGKRAVETRVLDNLDELLLGLNSDSDLISMRYGAYDAVIYQQTDWERQSATSLVELIDHTLRTIAPNDKIKSSSWFVADKTSKTGITRKHKIKFYLQEKHGDSSANTEEIIEKAWGLVEACRNKIESIKHTTDDKKEIENLIKLTEDALYYLLQE